MILQDKEREEIKSLVSAGQPIPEDLKAKLLASIRNGEPSLSGDPDHLCCDLGIDQPDRYVWTTFEDCRTLGGRAADNSMCGH